MNIDETIMILHTCFVQVIKSHVYSDSEFYWTDNNNNIIAIGYSESKKSPVELTMFDGSVFIGFKFKRIGILSKKE